MVKLGDFVFTRDGKRGVISRIVMDGGCREFHISRKGRMSGFAKKDIVRVIKGKRR